MMIGVTKLSRGLLRLFLAQKSIWQYGTTFNYFLEVAVIIMWLRELFIMEIINLYILPVQTIWKT